MEQVNLFLIFWCHYHHNLQHKDDVFTKSNQEGIDRVLNKNGEYAFMMESTVSAHIMVMMEMIHTVTHIVMIFTPLLMRGFYDTR